MSYSIDNLAKSCHEGKQMDKAGEKKVPKYLENGVSIHEAIVKKILG